MRKDRLSLVIPFFLLCLSAIFAPASDAQRRTQQESYDELAKDLTILKPNDNESLKASDFKNLNQLLARSVSGGERILETSRNDGGKTQAERAKNNAERNKKLATFVDYPRGTPVTATIKVRDVVQYGDTTVIYAYIPSQNKKVGDRGRHSLVIYAKTLDTSGWRPEQARNISAVVLSSDWEYDSYYSDGEYLYALTFSLNLLHIEKPASTGKPVTPPDQPAAEEKSNARASDAGGIPKIPPSSQPTDIPAEVSTQDASTTMPSTDIPSTAPSESVAAQGVPTGDWISQGATYRLSSNNSYHEPLAAFLTCEGRLHNESFAFHTAENKPGAFVEIDLGKPYMIDGFWIENRKDDGLEQRVKGLMVWCSLTKGSKGTCVWTAESYEREWTVSIRPTQARYVTIALPPSLRVPMHLAHAKIFGSLPAKN